MAFGDSPDDSPLREAWVVFCDKLKAAGDKVFKDYNASTPLQRADGFRFLTQNLGQAFDLALETKDTRFPVLHNFCNPIRKLGGDNADFIYTQAWIDGSSVYRISGNRGTARFFNIVVHGPRTPLAYGSGATRPLHEPFGDMPEANIFGHQLQCRWDSSFELYIGGPKREPNWLPTTLGTRKLFLRQGFDSWDESPATMCIERIDMAEPKPLPTPQTMIGAFEWAGMFITDLMNDNPDWAFEQGGIDYRNANRFPPLDNVEADKKRGRSIVNMYWEIAPDEALVVEFTNHPGFWAFTNMGTFLNSMDYLYRNVSYSPSRSRIDPDGRVRFVLAHDDPGYHNWIDTQGFVHGNLTYRDLMSTEETPIFTRLVKRAKLAEAMHPDSPRCTQEERIVQLRARFSGIRRRYNM